MKKRLEADLISIAHGILQLKDKSDINRLYLDTQKLYEKLSVLKFIEEHYGNVKPTIAHNYDELEKEVESFYNKEASLPEPTIIEMTETNLESNIIIEEKTTNIEDAKEDIVEEETSVELNTVDTPIETTEPTVNEEITVEKPEISEAFEADIKEEQPLIDKKTTTKNTAEKDNSDNETPPGFKAAFEISEDIEAPKKPELVQISFEDLLGVNNYNDTLFVKVDEVDSLSKNTAFETAAKSEAKKETPFAKAENKLSEKTVSKNKNVSLNDKFSKGINIDLNDQIAFVKHLFGNNTEDYNRVLNQLITFDNFYETRNFIENMVKPDYNNWEGKDDYVDRFMDIIEKKFL